MNLLRKKRRTRRIRRKKRRTRRKTKRRKRPKKKRKTKRKRTRRKIKSDQSLLHRPAQALVQVQAPRAHLTLPIRR